MSIIIKYVVGPIKYIMGKLLHVHAGYANIAVQFKLSAAGRGGDVQNFA